MRYPTAWCAEIRPRPTRSTPPISPTGRKPRPPPRARGHPCTPPAAFRAPSLRPFALNPLGAIAFDRVHVRTTRWIAASGGSRGSAALTAPFYSPAPLVEPLVSRSATRNFPPRSHPNRFQPALDARSTSLIPCTQSCKRSRLKKFFSPGRACCSDCLKVRRPPRPLPPDPILLMCPIPPFADRAQKKIPPPPQPAPRRIADISPHPKTFPDSADASDRARSGSWPSARRKPSRSARRWRRRLGRRRRRSSSRARRRSLPGRSLPGRHLPPCGTRSSRSTTRGSPRSTRPSRRSSRRRARGSPRLRAPTERRRRRRQPRRRRRRRSALSPR